MTKRSGVGQAPEINGGNGIEEYAADELRDNGDESSSRGSRFTLIQSAIGLASTRRTSSRQTLIDGLRDLSRGLVIHPDNRTDVERDSRQRLHRQVSSSMGEVHPCVGNVLVILYTDGVWVLQRIAEEALILGHLRYLKSYFIIDLLSCMPWDIIYKASGRKEELRYLLWIRLSRVRIVDGFFKKLEKDIRINYLFTRIIKLIAVEIYCTHTAACIFYYLATTLPEDREAYTWIGSLKLGDFSYSNFREIDIWKRYTTSMYFAIVTMATVGYGDIHAVNLREMIFVMIYVSFDMVLGAYLIGNMTALIVKGSKTVRYRDKMTDLIKFVNRNKIGRDIRSQIKIHLRLQYESSYTDAAVLQDIPISIRAKISQSLYKSYIENIPLLKGCSSELINQIEEVGIAKDGSEETVARLEPNSSFGEVSILCNIPQPYTVRVCELCRLLRIDKQSFSNILDIFFHDGRRILDNLLEGKESNTRIKQLESDVSFHIGKQEAELALKVNNAAFHGDLHQLKSLITAGADPNKKDYDGRSPLHLAASRGYEAIALYLIQSGVDLNAPDNFGNTPLLEAIKNGHDRVASLLVKEGASLKIENAGSFLCEIVVRGDSDILRRLLSYGVDPNSKDYDHRTPLHIAASQGLYSMAKLLLGADGEILQFDGARASGNKQLIQLLEEAKSAKLSEFPGYYEEDSPAKDKDARKHGVVLWVPQSIKELVEIASRQLELNSGSYILTEDGGKILDTDMISDGQKLYLIISETQ
nr:potassium channel SKOR-like isoform X2 [Ipomoea batatas]